MKLILISLFHIPISLVAGISEINNRVKRAMSDDKSQSAYAFDKLSITIAFVISNASFNQILRY
ncbi:hypothetical protein A6770_35685 [Nostoc minutum NIES-26]|uniref:Uncharacterized protein n=1 Tax=Nostoc minutum NIES-26 TaxID=1844469 RepID=A0A367S1X2_9NOSO|nr:hypothetical protein A6770_35685 [Nostoc minutum NIES-26]